jgi:hypothetical protein
MHRAGQPVVQKLQNFGSLNLPVFYYAFEFPSWPETIWDPSRCKHGARCWPATRWRNSTI